jgi:hypothetical protein
MKVRHMHPKKPKGLGLGSGFRFFGFGYFANLLQISNKIIQNNFFSFLGMDDVPKPKYQISKKSKTRTQI